MPSQYVQVRHIRYLVGFYAALYLFVVAAFGSHLASILTIPGDPHQIDTLRELADSGHKVITLTRYRALLNQNLKTDVRRKLIPKIETILEVDNLKYLTKPRQHALICKNHLADYALIHKNNLVGGANFYRLMREKPMPSLACYAMKYGSPFLYKINTILARLIESGIYRHWRQAAMFNISFRDNYKQRRPRRKHLSLSLINLEIPFCILMAGLVVSIFVFAVERNVTFSCIRF